MEDNEIDNLLSDDTDYTPFDLEVEQAENICGDLANVAPPPMVITGLPQLIGKDYPKEFLSIIDRAHSIYRMFPDLDHESIYQELVTLSVEAKPTPTPQLIDAQLHKVQAVKERLSEIMVKVGRVHSFKKRQVDILKESWIHFSVEKSADKRKADAVYRVSEFESDFLLVDSIWRTAQSILNNLCSVQEILSRRITIHSQVIKMHEAGRHTFPDYEFNNRSLDDAGGSEIGTPVEDDDESGILKAEECSF
jgi:hypothetical protein